MEIRCTECGHVGPAASVVPSASGVELVCENCDHRNTLDVPAKAPDAGPTAPEPATTAAEPPRSAWLSKEAFERLIPTPGAGPRCRKCAQLLEGDDNCPRCGLNAEEAARFPRGDAPWDAAPQGKEAAFEQANLLWNSVEEHATDDNLGKFVAFAREEELLELGIRKLRFFLADHPGHELALSNLKELAQSFQAKMIVARAQAEVRADNIVATTTRLRTVMLWAVFLIFGSIFVIFLSAVLSAT